MVSTPVPITPNSRGLQSSAVNLPAGTWRHPQFDEITRRQSRTTFTERNIKKVLWNGGVLLGTWALAWWIRETPKLSLAMEPLVGLATYPILLFRILLAFNIFLAMLPLILPKDELVDIPLTPSQRALLGLDPNVTPNATPGSQYSTPPRYPRSSTPRSGASEGYGSSYSNSPLSGKGSPSFGKNPAEPAFSPSINPLLQKAIAGGGRDATKRRSLGLSTPLTPVPNGLDSSLISLPSTPSPSGGKGAGLNLNSKWLYERSRNSPVGSTAYS